MRRRILRWGPPPDLMTMREAMDRLLEEGLVRTPRRFVEPILGHELVMDIYETAQAVVVQALVPGIKPKDLNITIMGDTLTIRGETYEDAEVKREQYIRREIQYGELFRSVTLPGGLESEKAGAHFENGVLTLTIPKAEQVRPTVIRVKAS